METAHHERRSCPCSARGYEVPEVWEHQRKYTSEGIESIHFKERIIKDFNNDIIIYLLAKKSIHKDGKATK